MLFAGLASHRRPRLSSNVRPRNSYSIVPWNFLHVGPEGMPVVLKGVDLWAHEWKGQDELPIPANHPEHTGQKHELRRYFVQAGGHPIEFAAGEVSPGVWLFYGPTEDVAKRQLLLKVIAYAAVCVGTFLVVRGIDQSLQLAVVGGCLVLFGLWIEYERRWSAPKSEA